MAAESGTTPNAAEIAQLMAILSEGAAPAALGPLGFALSAAPEVIKVITALNQAKEAKALAAKTVRPTYTIPKEVSDVVDIMRSGYMNSRLPGQAQAEGRLQANTASGFSAARESGNNPNAIMATLMGLNQQQNQGFEDLATQGANLQRQDRAGYVGALNNMAGYRDQAFEYNQNQPYQQALKTIGALRQSSTENAYGAAKGISSSLIGAMNNMPNDWWKKFDKTNPAAGAPDRVPFTMPEDIPGAPPSDLYRPPVNPNQQLMDQYGLSPKRRIG